MGSMSEAMERSCRHKATQTSGLLSDGVERSGVLGY